MTVVFLDSIGSAGRDHASLTAATVGDRNGATVASVLP